MKLRNTKFRGFFNKYHKKMPFFEILLKDLNYMKLWIQNYVKNGQKSKSIFVYPHYPSRGSTIYKIGQSLGYNITNKLKQDVKFAVYWEYLTFREEFRLLEKLSAELKVINLYNRDISKLYIDNVHKEVFGYSTLIDPTKYTGLIVKKNDINAMHDGQIIQAPIKSVEKGYIYQLLIDNTYSDERVMDIRVPVVGKVLDFVYLKFRNVSERFKNTTTNTKLEAIHEYLEESEIGLLNEYCKHLGLEYGELDVLRNKNDNKIYVVDVNNTPQGPPANISEENAKIALSKIAGSLLDYTTPDKSA